MKIPALTICLLSITLSYCQTKDSGYNIEFDISGLKDTTLLLASYYGESKYVKDTAKIDDKGRIVFHKDKTLDEGLYFLVKGKGWLFDFVIGKDQNFKIKVNSENYYKDAEVTGDIDNKLFFENIAFNNKQHEKADPYINILKDSTLNDEAKKDAAKKAYLDIENEVKEYQQNLIAQNPELVTSRILKSLIEVEIPPAPKKEDGKIDSTFMFTYYRDHFFDNFDLSDDALLRTPTPHYMEKLNTYLDKLFLQSPDTIIKAIEKLVLMAKKNQETYKYLVWTCLGKYERPKIMGLEEVYVYLYDKYYASKEMDFWISDKLKSNLKDYADKIRGNLIGKAAANLSMQDSSFQRRSLYDIKKKYTLVYFYDPDCGHCRTETPKLVEFYNKNKVKFNLEVFAVNIDSSMQKMKDYIKEMKMKFIIVNGPRSYLGQYNKSYFVDSTPACYLLDEKKKIIARLIPIESLEDFIEGYEEFNNKKKI